MKLRILITLIAIISINSIAFSQQEKYSKVKIYTDGNGLKTLSKAGVTIDHGSTKKGVFFISDFSATELAKINSLGFKTEVLIDDVVADFLKHKTTPKQAKSIGFCGHTPNVVVPANFAAGSMGSYFTYQEILNNLDSMAARYPNIISVKQQVSTELSIEGRPLYWVKISNNPNINQAKPQILYDALHHAREPGCLSQLIFYMWYLLENYATNPEVQFVVNNTEMYFIPCVNPDGYIYNETTNPGGGGMWRKNRRNNGDGTMGVDLNRNYGSQWWGYDNVGSSPNTVDDTYRGTSGFSEPELQAVRDFCNQHQFKIAINYHTFGNDLIYPYGYAPAIYTPDSALYVNDATVMTTENGFTFGTGDQTVGYVTNGDSDDWMYDEHITKPKILAMTPEVGDAFWMDPTTLIDMCKSTLRQNLKSAELITKYATVEDKSANNIYAPTGNIAYDITRLGLDNTGVYTVTLTGISTAVTSVGAPNVYNSLTLLQSFLDSISYTLDTSILNYGDIIKFSLSVNNGLYSYTDTLMKVYGTPQVIYYTNCTAITGFTSTSWGITTESYVTAPTSISDSPYSNYSDNANTEIQTTNTIDLTGALEAHLEYYTKWHVEPNFDYVQVLGSSDNGATWTSLCGKYTTAGGVNQAVGEPVYDGFQGSWVKEFVSLNAYLGQHVLIKFALISDGGVNYDGFYFDDFKVTKITVVPLSIKEANIARTFNMYPNPTNGIVHVDFYTDKNKETKLIITDATGRNIKEKHYSNTTYINENIDIQTLENGVYYLNIYQDKTITLTKKLIIIK